MADDDRVRRHQRDGDGESFVSHARAADAGLSMGRRWVEIAVLLVGFGITIGINLQKFSNLTDKVDAIARRQDNSDEKATRASVDSQVAKELASDAKKKTATNEYEQGQWRAFFQAIAMVQQQGGGMVTLRIPAKPKQEQDGGQR